MAEEDKGRKVEGGICRGRISGRYWTPRCEEGGRMKHKEKWGRWFRVTVFVFRRRCGEREAGVCFNDDFPFL